MQIDQAAALAHAALHAFGVPSHATITFVKHRENHVFRADADGDSYAVRLHRPGYRSDDEIRTELEYVRALRGAGVPVPELLTTTDGSPFARVTAGGHERVVSMQRWLRGAEQFGSIEAALAGAHSPDPREFHAIGELLARLHVAATRIGLTDRFDRSAWDADGLAGPAPLWGDPTALPGLDADARALLDAARGTVHEQLRSLGTDADRFGVVHADATPENILVTDAGLTLIDFDDFGTGWFVFDLVTALFHHTGHPRADAYARALLEGYASIRPLSSAELDAWDALDVARGLSYLGWGAERPDDPASAFIAEHVAPIVLRAATALVAGEPAPWRVVARGKAQEGTR